MSKQTKVGAALIAAGITTPVIAHFVIHRVLALNVVYNPGAPPNQGAMMQGFLAFLASVAVGILLLGIGAGVLFVSLWRSRQ